ncbi:YcjX family protein [Pseudoalteromonas sp. T1lg65]|uniref:YcjX family protein n=1 Tax=Pseudoalteromonas sp. T1lg65 TaxID=2077101 RepID=UPI003F79CB16
MTSKFFSSSPAIEQLKQHAKKTLHRSLDRHVKLAVTGFSGSGKTAFITALIKHLTTQATEDNLPFFDVVREGRLVACKPEPQKALQVPTFDYQKAISSLMAPQPHWPESTKRINTLRLAFKYHSQHGLKQHFSDTHTLYLELYDYPGEWLMDLPMLKMDYRQWCEQQFIMFNKPKYQPFASQFIEQSKSLDINQPVDEAELKRLSVLYQQLLMSLKDQTQLSNLQPGRALIPGDLEGAPLLAFFPIADLPEQLQEGSQAEQLQQRFEAYKKQVILPFYKDYFCQFDRQVVLVDLLGSLNDGFDTFSEQEQALKQILAMFSHGKSGLLSRLFNAKIDKVLFAANKCDSVSANVQTNLTRLLNDIVQESCNELKFSGVEVDTMSLSSVKCSQARVVKEQGESLHCVYGRPTGEQEYITYLPPTPPEHRLAKTSWPEHGYEFLSFEPFPAQQGNIQHVRLDHALQFLIGDKLR